MPRELPWAQASLLAGVVQAPTAYDPLTHLNLTKQRQRDVLDRLVNTGVFSRAQADAAFAPRCAYRYRRRNDPNAHRGAQHHWPTHTRRWALLPEIYASLGRAT